MYAIVEKNKLEISLAQFYSMDWYAKGQLFSEKEPFIFEYGSIEVDVHKNGKMYLTGFVIDPRVFIVDYLKTRYKRIFEPPKKIVSVSVSSSEHTKLFSVDFFKSPGFVIDGMEKDLIFPSFVEKNDRLIIQGFEVLYPISVIKYLVKRFKFRDTMLVRSGNDVYDMKSGRKWKITRK